jgi:hypothetical protein
MIGGMIEHNTAAYRNKLMFKLISCKLYSDLMYMLLEREVFKEHNVSLKRAQCQNITTSTDLHLKK